MQQERNQALEYIRGASMLGVIGIHTGAYSLANPDVNIHVFALLEICTRFSVPIFFFISAFGLFSKQDLSKPFAYGRFLLSRVRSVLIPYLVWSVLYMIHYSWISGDTVIWSKPLVYEYFLFGLASYQLYFLVILLWFYLLMPLWRQAVRMILPNPVLSLGILLVAQIAFNYYSCYILTSGSDNYYINLALQHRLSYWVLHYLFIFLLGATCAVQQEAFSQLLARNHRKLFYGFAVTLSGMLLHYYFLLYQAGYTPEAAVNTVQQLSPIGVLYTAATSLFLYELFSRAAFHSPLLGKFGSHSFAVYLVHPFVMYYLSDYLINHHLIMDVPVTLLFFTLTVLLSLVLAVCIRQLSVIIPFTACLLSGGNRQKVSERGTH